MATIRDIAKKAKVSVGTVSRYLGGTMKVKPETAERIDQAVKDMNYVRNSSAASIKTKRSNVVALVFPSMQSLIFGEIAEAINNALSERGYILTTYTTGDELEKEVWATEKMREQRIAGAIFITEPMGDKSTDHLELLEKSGIKTLLINRFFGVNDFNCISADYASGLEQIAEHLKEEGYRKVGLLGGWPDQNHSVVDRVALVEAAGKQGLDFSEEDAKYMYYQEELVKEKTLEMLRDGVDAIVIVSDRWAVEVLDIVEQEGLRIPEDVAVIGMGNTKYAKIRRMTSLDIGLKQLGETAAETLLASFDGAEIERYREIESELVVRGTSKRK